MCARWSPPPASPEPPRLAPVELNSVECCVPRITFDQDCNLFSLNEAGRLLFGSEWAFFGQTFSSLFPHGQFSHDDGKRTAKTAPLRLQELVTSSRTRPWDEGGVALQYALPSGELRRAEASVVQHPHLDPRSPNGFTLFLLRALPNLVVGLDNLYVDQSRPEHQPGRGIDLSSMGNAVAAVTRELTGIGMSDEEQADPMAFGRRQLNFHELTQLVNEFPHICFTTKANGAIDYLNKQASHSIPHRAPVPAYALLTLASVDSVV